MGRSLPSPQIHQKFICVRNSSYKTHSECWQKTLDFQKGKPISLEWSKAKDEGRERERERERERISGWRSLPQGGSQEGGKVSSHSWVGTRGSFITSAAAAAKSLQSCPTLCDLIDSSPTGSPVPGILQARTLEWVAISFSNAWKWKGKVKSPERLAIKGLTYIHRWSHWPSNDPSNGKLR